LFPEGTINMSARLRMATIGLALLVAGRAAGADFGSFVGDVVARWLDVDRRKQVTEDFAYIDPQGSTWNAPKNSIVDGACRQRPRTWSVCSRNEPRWARRAWFRGESTGRPASMRRDCRSQSFDLPVLSTFV
jgi:hypothetical protein